MANNYSSTTVISPATSRLTEVRKGAAGTSPATATSAIRNTSTAASYNSPTASRTSSVAVPTTNTTAVKADPRSGATAIPTAKTSTSTAAAVPVAQNAFNANNAGTTKLDPTMGRSMSSTELAALRGQANSADGSPYTSAYTSAYGDLWDYYSPTTAEEEVPEVAPNALSAEAAERIKDYLNTYNTDREQKIRDMYAGNIAAQNAQQKTAYDSNMGALRTAYEANLGNLKTAYDNNTASLRTAYDTNLAQIANTYQQNLSDAEAYREGISPQYQQSMNALGAEYERQRRNNNMQAAVNGLNTGTGSQLALGQSMAYQANQGNLARSENEALNEAERSIYNLGRDYRNRQDILNTEYANNVDKLNREYANQQATYGTTYQNNLLDLQTNYQNKIAEAAANNDYQMAAALLDEYGAQYERTMQQAEQLAQFGDFSMFANIYGIEAAQQMEKNWAFQNPDLAYNLGRITAEEYQAITGMLPRGYSSGGGYYGGGSYSSNKSSSSFGLQKRIEDNMAKAKQMGQISAVINSGGLYVPKEFDAGGYGNTKFYGIPAEKNPTSGTNKNTERERVSLKTYNTNNR